MNSQFHEPNAGEVQSLLAAMTGRRIAVVGDAMLDAYLAGPAERISPEARSRTSPARLAAASFLSMNGRDSGRPAETSTYGRGRSARATSSMTGRLAVISPERLPGSRPSRGAGVSRRRATSWSGRMNSRGPAGFATATGRS